MAPSTSAASLLIVLAVVVCSPAAAEADKYPPLAKGLSFDFYEKSCPSAESIVKAFLREAIQKDVGLAAALIRLHFHDCFVQGCDGSILLDRTPTEQSEKEAGPNLTLRPSAFKAVNDIRALLHKACGLVVSCADIVTLAARDSVHLWATPLTKLPTYYLSTKVSPKIEEAGGPRYKVPLGRRDSLKFGSEQDVFDALPPPTSNVTTLLRFLAKINLDINDLVALSGGHTVGIAHCSSFDRRLFEQDPTMDPWFASHLRLTCPVENTTNTTVNDIRTPNTFDNKYYVDLLHRQGLFTSDQDMFTDARTGPIVTKFAFDQWAFFEQFIFSMVKMGQIQVLTGAEGQIRTNCSVRNAGYGDLPWSVVEAAESLVL